MDNNFYNERRARHKPQQQQTGFMTRIIIVQFVLSMLITGILFLSCRGDGGLSQSLKAYYKQICKTDIAVSEIIDNVKRVTSETFSPRVQEEKIKEETNTGEATDTSPVFLFVNDI